MILLLDNYDSFTYNIVQYLEQLGAEVMVVENDNVSLQDIEALRPDAMVLGPGPGKPEDAGITLSCVHHFAGKLPILGICLGHQAIAQAFGAHIVQASQIMHGRTSLVYHLHDGLFKGIDNPTAFTRYHSLIIDKTSLPDTLAITAWTQTERNTTSVDAYPLDENYSNEHEVNAGHQAIIDIVDTDSPIDNVNEIMAIRHTQLPITGVQFHPESILSHAGLTLLSNFLTEYL